MGDQKSKEFETSFLKAGLSVDRRDFLKLIGGGIIVFFTCDASDLFGQEGRGPATRPISTPICGSLRMGK